MGLKCHGCGNVTKSKNYDTILFHFFNFIFIFIFIIF